jgi:hypothetical protein
MLSFSLGFSRATCVLGAPSGIVPSPTNDTDLVNCCGELGCLEDWVFQRVETTNLGGHLRFADLSPTAAQLSI